MQDHEICVSRVSAFHPFLFLLFGEAVTSPLILHGIELRYVPSHHVMKKCSDFETHVLEQMWVICVQTRLNWRKLEVVPTNQMLGK